MDKIDYNDENDLLETTDEGILIKQCLNKINEIIECINSNG